MGGVGLGKMTESRARGQQIGQRKRGNINLVAVVGVVGESQVGSPGIEAEVVGSGAWSFVPPMTGPPCHQGYRSHEQRG